MDYIGIQVGHGHTGWIASLLAKEVLHLLKIGRPVARARGSSAHKLEAIGIERVIPALIPIEELEFQQMHSTGSSLAALRGLNLEVEIRQGTALVSPGTF